MDWVTNLCNCFSPQLRRNIIGYLSASNLNRQVLQQQKCTQEIDQKDEQSIYVHAKARSYYSIERKDYESKSSQYNHNKISQTQRQHQQQQNNQIQFQSQGDSYDPHWYPMNSSMTYDQIYEHKLKTLKYLLDKQIDEQYQKVIINNIIQLNQIQVYDSQDDSQLIIYAKNQLQKGKKINVYRFQFNIKNTDSILNIQDFNNLQTVSNQGKSFVQSLLKNRQILRKTQQGLQICYRTYEKKLVISQHDFITAENSILQEELDEDLSSQNKQVYNKVAYNICFSVKNVKDEKSVLFQRGNVNLCGMKVYKQAKMKKSVENNEESSKQIDKQMKIKGYINVQLDTNVNSNMLKQPVAKQIRIYVQKIISLLQNTDAI